jgi:DNA-binding LytR/AlgR family response regulator
MMATMKVLVHVGDGERRVVESASIFFVEAQGGDTRIRQRGKRLLRDVRELGEIERAWRRHGFVRIHDDYLVNPARILKIRKRSDGRQWEVIMGPPVNSVIPVSRRRVEALWAAFEGEAPERS